MLLVHPGGLYWRNRDKGGWQIPKGAIEPGETPLLVTSPAQTCRYFGRLIEGPILLITSAASNSLSPVGGMGPR